MRLYQVASGSTTRFAWDGLDMIAEYDGSNALQRRYVHGPGIDEPLVQYEGSGTFDRRFLHADERGSIAAVSDASGNLLNINRYDEFGKPQGTNSGRFQYTGQMWLGELGLHYYKARMYSAHLGRFLQADPIGYAGGANLYAYVGNDPVNLTDPLGLSGDVFVTATLCHQAPALCVDTGGIRGAPTVGGSGGVDGPDIVVTCDAACRARKLGGRPKYRRTWRITRQGTECTAEQARSAMLNAAVPGRSGENVSGQTYDVSWFGSSLFTGPDTIRFRTNGSNSFINETLGNHYLRYGTVMGTLSGNQQSGFFFSVQGSGSNIDALRAFLNKVLGPEVFRSAARQMNQELLATCGG